MIVEFLQHRSDLFKQVICEYRGLSEVTKIKEGANGSKEPGRSFSSDYTYYIVLYRAVVASCHLLQF